jgi:hypothetical protein
MSCAHHPDGLLPVDAREAAPRRGRDAVPRTPRHERLEAVVFEAVLR